MLSNNFCIFNVHAYTCIHHVYVRKTVTQTHAHTHMDFIATDSIAMEHMEHMEHTHGLHCYATHTWTSYTQGLQMDFHGLHAMKYPWKSNEIFKPGARRPQAGVLQVSYNCFCPRMSVCLCVRVCPPPRL